MTTARRCGWVRSAPAGQRIVEALMSGSVAWFSESNCPTTARPTTPRKSSPLSTCSDWCATTRTTDDDFRSQRWHQPLAKFRGVTECRARGVSVFGDVRDARRRQSRPRFKASRICRVTLARGAGWIQPTGSGSHLTWWPLASYDIVGNSAVD